MKKWKWFSFVLAGVMALSMASSLDVAAEDGGYEGRRNGKTDHTALVDIGLYVIYRRRVKTGTVAEEEQVNLRAQIILVKALSIPVAGAGRI